MRRHPCRGWKTGIGILALAAAGCIPAPPPPPSIIVYGDSLTSQSSSYIGYFLAQQRPGWNRYFRSYGGTAICDYLDEMNADGNLNAKVVVIQFSGNDMSPCMAGSPAESAAWFARYRTDASYAANLWKARGARVLFVGNPRGVCAQPPHPLDDVYRQVAAQYGMRFTDAPALALTVELQPAEGAPTAPPIDPLTAAASEPALVAASQWPCAAPAVPTRVFAFAMPCLSFEDAAHGCVGGSIAVRDGTAGAPGAHFDRHGSYSAGGFRFGVNIATEAARLMA